MSDPAALTLGEFEQDLKEAFREALQDRFKTIAANAISGSLEEERHQIDATVRNLMQTYEEAVSSVRRAFGNP